MRVLLLAHDHVSPPGPVAEQFAARGYDIAEALVVQPHDYYEPNQPYDFPDPADFDALVPMGSPWGAWDDDTIGEWLLPELQWLRKADAAGVPVLGICFGGQLLARAHGGQVGRAPRAEIGWTHIWSDNPGLIAPGPGCQFHYDRWQVPPGAIEIARTPSASQAFTLRRNLAVQFHPELTAPTLAGWFGNDGRPLVEADGQDPDVLLAFTAAEEGRARIRAHALVDAFLDQVAAR